MANLLRETGGQDDVVETLRNKMMYDLKRERKREKGLQTHQRVSILRGEEMKIIHYLEYFFDEEKDSR